MVASIIFPALIPAGVSGYTIENAIWLDGSADYLSHTFGSAGNRKTWTFSTWAKRADTWNNITIFAQGDYNGDYTALFFSGEKLYYQDYGAVSGNRNTLLLTDGSFRDSTAWYHFLLINDTSSAVSTATDRTQIWVNGVRVSQAYQSSKIPAQDATSTLNTASAINIGRYPANDPGGTYKGYLAETIFVDGTAHSATDFGEYNSENVWTPKDPSGLTFGTNTNSFWFEFKDSNDLSKDSSGNTDHTRVTTTGGTWANASGFSQFDATKFDNGGYNDARAFTINGTGNRFTYDHGSGNSLALSQVGMANDNAGGNSSAAKWKVEHSDNGSDWTDTSQFCDYTDGGENSTSPQYATFTGQSAHRYWAWEVVVDRTGGASHGVYEIELYEQGASYWTVNSIDANNVVVDSPSDDSGAEVTLYPVLDGVNTGSQQGTLSNNSKTMTVSSGNWSGYRINMPVKSGGKIYFEFVTAGDLGQGAGLTTIVGNIDQPGAGSPYVGKTGNYSMQLQSGFWTPSNAVNVPTGHETGGHAAYYKCAYDDSNGKLWFGDADGWYGSSVSDSDVAAGNSNTYTVAADDRGGKLYIYCSGYTNGGNTTLRLLSSEWSSSAPSGFNALTQTVTGVGSRALWNPLDVQPSYVPTFSNGNLTATGNGGSVYSECRGTIGISSGKFVIQITPGSTLSNGALFGVCRVSDMRGTSAISSATGTKGVLCRSDNGGQIYSEGSAVQSSLGTWDKGNAMRVEVNADDGTVAFFKDGTAYGSAVSSITFNEPWVFIWMPFTGYQATLEHSISKMSGTVTSGFKEWTTFNLPEPTVTKPDDHFGTLLWTGNQTVRTIKESESGVEGTPFTWTPDFIWIKSRVNPSSGHFHHVYDSVRGADAGAIYTNSADAEDTYEDGFDDFVGGGFSTVNSGNYFLNSTNNSATYVAWCLKAGGGPTADHDHTDNSGAMDANSVSVGGVLQSSYTPAAGSNYPKKMSIASHGGFSIVEYVGTGGNATVPHGLSRTPNFFMLKCTDHAFNPAGWHEAIGAQDKFISWMTTNGLSGDQGGICWQNNPVASDHVITFGSQTGQNGSGDIHIMYSWARTPGLIGIGSYTGNNAADGTMVIVNDGASGFKPAWVMVKRLESGYAWHIHNSVMSPHNPVAEGINANDDGGEASTTFCDFTANGFKLRTDGGGYNDPATYIYLAFAEQPFGGDGVAPATAR